jgi:methyl-accepting chemotaxis protein
MKKCIFTLVALVSLNGFAGDCTKADAKKAVEFACGAIEKKGDGAKADIKKYRYCGQNYVWVQSKELKMVLHPIKRKLTGKDLKGFKDKKGQAIFIAFDKKANAEAAGGWVDYVWPKPGEEDATPKTSFVKKCGGGKDWIAGSGIWK